MFSEINSLFSIDLDDPNMSNIEKLYLNGAEDLIKYLEYSFDLSEQREDEKIITILEKEYGI